MVRALLAVIIALFAVGPCVAQDKPVKKIDGNRLAYLDEINPYYPHKDFAKLITPQWVGEEGVEAVVILAIDDMKDPKKYEAFLRPILNRLKKIDGRAPVSIMTCAVEPKEEQLQKWLMEGLSLECHTFDHPCPFFAKGFVKAKETYDKCVDLLHEVPNNKPVAFRMPCCDSMNTPSPRFYAQIFHKVTDKKNFLAIDSSVFNVFTSADPELPKDLVLDDKGNDRFKPYLPADRSFVNTIENYPYPYVLGRLCWQFPCMTPSDWQAQHRHKPNNPQTVADWKAALDCTVIKKGVFSMVFHPHGWIKNDQVVDFIDYAVGKHGKKVKFLTFKEAAERLVRNLTRGEPLRPRTPDDIRMGVLDLNNDGYMDVVTHEKSRPTCYLWSPGQAKWNQTPLEAQVWYVLDKLGCFGNVDRRQKLTVLYPTFMAGLQLNFFDGKAWTRGGRTGEIGIDNLFSLLEGELKFLDVDGDGLTELICLNQKNNQVLHWNEKMRVWQPLTWVMPQEFLRQFPKRSTAGLRFLDLDDDGKLDLIFSNEKEYGVYLFTDMEKGWNKKIMAGKRGDKDALPMISRNGTDNGFWVHSGHLWWSNEDTALMKDHVDRRNIKELLKKGK